MKLFNLFFFTVILFQTTFADSIRMEELFSSKSRIEYLIKQERDFGKDTVALKHYLNPILSYAQVYNDASLLIVYDYMLADGIAKAYDAPNDRSKSLYLSAIKRSIRNKDKELEFWMKVNYGFYLYDFRDITAAFPIFLEARNFLPQVSLNKSPNPEISIRNMAYFFGTIGDAEASMIYLNLARKHAHPKSNAMSSILDGLGMAYLKQADTVTAFRYFKEVEALSKETGDYVRLGKALGNQAVIYWGRGDLKKAVDLLLEDIVYSERYGSKQNTMYAYILLAKVYIDEGKLTEAENAINRAAMYASTKVYLKRSEKEITEVRLAIAVKRHDDHRELLARRRLIQLNDSLQLWNSDEKLQQLKWLADKQKYIHRIELSREQFEKELFKKRAYSIVIALLLALSISLYFLFTRKLKVRRVIYERHVLGLQMEKYLSDQKLMEANNNLSSFTVYLREKNEYIANLKEEIERVNQTSFSAIEHERGQLQALLESHLMTEDKWNLFKEAFIKEYPHFYNDLLSQYPELTESNLRFIFLGKLGLKNTEISNILGVTEDAVKKAKQRLKKKIGEERYTMLSTNLKL
ncbi:hypothetical protein MUB18_03545 [Sphingobacterium sp. PCS056]|uniref:hypothetical protein n=1 Tax=Sphingobacterium sp. PCS056 TaxID=2931400 RepID=UPI00200CBA22|nr:hypothetical protein [Sphingobacterium sp. PCS056]UPZ37385.1 hypothetical protein MUB18_03545 [Sphingobacterium sp. PCS056]